MGAYMELFSMSTRPGFSASVTVGIDDTTGYGA